MVPLALRALSNKKIIVKIGARMRKLRVNIHKKNINMVPLALHIFPNNTKRIIEIGAPMRTLWLK